MRPPPTRSRLARGYRALAVFLLHTTVLLVVLNVILGRWFPGRPSAPGPVRPGSAAYEDGVRRLVAQGVGRDQAPFFPGLDGAALAALQLETWVLRGYRYEPYVQFREGPYAGRFVTVDVHGFRAGRTRPPWPPRPEHANVFVFGGSTTFGYGVPDGETVPAHLERLLGRAHAGRPVRVYNFARGYFFSTQERLLLERLLAEGVRPDVAIFVDGLNDFYNTSGEPEFSVKVRRLWAGGGAPSPSLLTALGELPLARAARWLRRRLAGRKPAWRPEPPPRAAAAADVSAIVDGQIARWIENRHATEATAARHGIRVLFVWQPVPTYAYDLRHHPFADRGFGAHERSRVGYPRVAARLRAGTLGANVLWCADIQARLEEPLYVDTVHYTPRMARRVARCIARGVARRGLLVGARS